MDQLLLFLLIAFLTGVSLFLFIMGRTMHEIRSMKEPIQRYKEHTTEPNFILDRILGFKYPVKLKQYEEMVKLFGDTFSSRLVRWGGVTLMATGILGLVFAFIFLLQEITGMAWV